ncbi:MAG: thioesterase family protein [Gammaproteobacteria bacterium]|nr:thioesterase family protein [Gammaproteobacteria bacterium]
MNLYLRLLRILLKTPFARSMDLFATADIMFRVWPTDCDLNMHMNNGRYLTLMDLGRINFMARVGLLAKLVRRRWFPVIASVTSSYLRPLPPFRRFRLATRLLGWDEKYFYMEQCFYSNGRLCANMIVKGLMLNAGRPVPSEQVLALLDPGLQSPDIAELRQKMSLLANQQRHLNNSNPGNN